VIQFRISEIKLQIYANIFRYTDTSNKIEITVFFEDISKRLADIWKRINYGRKQDNPELLKNLALETQL